MTVKAMIAFLSILFSLIRVSWFSSSVQPVNIVQVSAREESEKDYSCADLDKQFAVTARQKLSLDTQAGGSIHIKGWNQNVVAIKTRAEDDEDCRIEMRQTSAGVEIESRYLSRRHDGPNLSFDIQVPAQFDVAVETTGGDVTIEGVEGKIEGRTMGGQLRFAQLKGQVDFTTMGGGITLTKSHLDGKLETMGGEVMLRDVTGNVKANSMGGTVTYDNVRKEESEKITGEVHLTSMGGDLDISDAPHGAYAHTMGGEIHVARAADHVKVETMGGNINLDAVDGWISAKTMGGDVTAKMIGDPSRGKRDVDITSYGGDIELMVPAGLSMNFQLELAYTKNKIGRYEIQSDFPLKQEESKDWDYDDGTPRKYISGTGRVGSGTNQIRIHTINGNIVIKKGS